MKENKYDNDKFFEQYSAFPRSVKGLSVAGEWHELKKLLPDFKDKKMLDIGCGFGWHCQYAAQQGASKVLGIDISEKMLQVAKEKNEFSNVVYKQSAMEDINFKSEEFDIVISSLAFHYTPDFKDICLRVNDALKNNGDFVFSVEHPIFTAQGKQDWIYNEQGQPEYWPVDNYFNEGAREAIFLEEKVIKYHKTLTTYLNTLIETGFNIIAIVEPKPTNEALEEIAEMRNELRRPMMLLISAKKL